MRAALLAFALLLAGCGKHGVDWGDVVGVARKLAGCAAEAISGGEEPPAEQEEQ